MTRALTSKQLAILKTLFAFRFGTADLIAERFNLIDGRYIHARLRRLQMMGYIGRHYDTSYKLAGKPAAYYLLPKAFPALKSFGVPQQALHNMYKNQSASEAFVARCLLVYAAHNKLNKLYGDLVNFHSKSNLYQHEDLPQPLPDAYVSYKRTLAPQSRPRQYFLEVIDEARPLFVHAKRLQAYIEYCEDGAWEDAHRGSLTGILFVCSTASLERRFQKRAIRYLDFDDESTIFATTTADRVRSGEEDVWQIIGRPHETFTLPEIRPKHPDS